MVPKAPSIFHQLWSDLETWFFARFYEDETVVTMPTFIPEAEAH